MNIYTDDQLFVEKNIQNLADWQSLSGQSINEPYHNPVLKKIFSSPDKIFYTTSLHEFWKEIYVVKHSVRSQFEIARHISDEGISLPNGVIFLAGSGDNFKGFRNRSWTASPGNLHLSIHFAPNKPINNFLAGFLSLAAVSVVEAIYKVDGLKEVAGIKWVNDIMLGNAKVGGVLTHTQSKGDQITSALLGIGINVATIPEILPDIFVPRATCIQAFLEGDTKISSCSLLTNLLTFLKQNYETLIKQGSGHLIQKYREYSCILGKHVQVYSDPISSTPELFAKGKVLKIGENLELIIENNPRPITKGRLVVD